MRHSAADRAAAAGQHDYRPHIDGLRAIAILSVIIYHAVPTALPGGFVGVDVFFVISGYLISGIIFRQLDQQRFSFADFYIRRIRRIFPALTVVLLFVLLAGWLALLTDEYRNLGLHVAAGAGSLQNILLWTETGYFNVFGNLKPLLHLWSLGIEEQFYLVWPLFVVLFGRSARMLSLIIIALAIASFAIGLRYLGTDQDAAFYLPFARFWELMMGCWLANQQRRAAPFDERQGTGTTATRRYRYALDMISVTGALLITAAVFGIDSTDPFPGWRALLPTLGTALLIQAGPAAKVNYWFLSHPVAVFVGLISYPLYLWHWPLLSFGHIITDNLTSWVKVALMLIAVLLAWLTYLWVERPLRSRTPRLPTAVGLGITMASIAAMGLVVNGEYIKPRSAGFGLEEIVAGASTPFSPPATLPTTTWQDTPFPTVGSGQKTSLILGDSHAEHYYARVDQLLQDGALAGRKVVFGSHPACPPIPEVSTPLRPDCKRVLAAALAYAMEPDVDTVIIAANWSAYLNSIRQPYTIGYQDREVHINVGTHGFEIATQNLKGLITGLIQAGKRVYVVLQMPRNDRLDPRQAVDRDFPFFNFRISPASVSAEEVRGRFAPLVEPIRELADSAGATVIDPVLELCSDEVCPALAPNGIPIYHDDGHFSVQFARHFVTFLDPAFGTAAATR